MQTTAECFRVHTEDDSVAQANADTNSWDVSALPGAHWFEAPEEWQALNRRWRSPSDVEISGLSTSPASFSLDEFNEEDEQPRYYLPRILVRDSYKRTFDSIWSRGLETEVCDPLGQGQIITGQPGIGKTVFMWYMLIRLLEKKQVVLFSLDGKRAYLFCGNKVYQCAKDGDLLNSTLPRPKRDTPLHDRVFIWSLFDLEEMKEPERPLIAQRCFSVQSASPNRQRYAKWQKEANAKMYYMPLWTEAELRNGLPYQRRYPKLSAALQLCLPGSLPAQIPGFPGVADILRRVNRPEPMTVQAAIDILLVQAIEDFGYTARDVYQAVFNPDTVRRRHEDVMS